MNLYGGVRAWAATDLPTARTVFEDHPHLSKNSAHWGAYTRDEDDRLTMTEVVDTLEIILLAGQAELTSLISPALNGLAALPVILAPS